MHPIEHLRYVARYRGGDAVGVAEEAAIALGSLGSDARALVPSCRRLLEAHPSCGPLYWVAARLICAEHLGDEVSKVLDLLRSDPTSEELAAGLESSADVAAEASGLVISALGMRPDVEIRLLGPAHELRTGLRAFGFDANVSGWDIDEADDAVVDADLAVVDALIAGPQGFIVTEAGRHLARSAQRARIPLWVCVGTGRLLPATLFSRALSMNGLFEHAATSEGDKDVPNDADTAVTHGSFEEIAAVQYLAASDASRVVGPHGIAGTKVGLARASCRAPSELLFSASER